MMRHALTRSLLIAFCTTLLVVLGEEQSAAQITPKAPKITPGDLAKTDTFKKLKDGLKKLKELSDKKDKWEKDVEKLSPEDDQYEPEYDLPGSPELPLLCKDSRECEDCYKQAYLDLQSTRFRFDKLRRVNKVTKNMLRDAISFGDAAASAAGGIAGLAWAKEKEKVRASEESFNQSYDAKYEELLATLKKNLLDIAVCEEKIFHNPSWYERFGYFYQQFMAEAYRRPN
jgi:hypothetical protein